MMIVQQDPVGVGAHLHAQVCMNGMKRVDEDYVLCRILLTSTSPANI